MHFFSLSAYTYRVFLQSYMSTSAPYCRAIAPVSVYRSLLCSRPALSHVFSSFQVLTSPSCHDLSSKYEVRGSRPAPAKAASPVVLISLLIISDGSVIQ